MSTLEELGRRLERLEGAGYGAYRQVRGAWEGPGWTLLVDRVQVDPFAPPSIVRVRLPRATGELPEELWADRPRRTGLEDFVLRAFRRACERMPRPGGGSGGSGRIEVGVRGPAILERSGCSIEEGELELRFRVGLPARGRRAMGRAAAEIFVRHLPSAIEAVRWEGLDREGARRQALYAEDHEALLAQLAERGLCAFVRDGSILPRSSGVSQEPLEGAVPFESPPSLRVTLTTPNAGDVIGMGIGRGITVLSGGGFHGKTTLLEALQVGVYPHVPGDGREWVAAAPDAVKVRSEDGRAVTGLDLSPFISDLPQGRDTRRFTTADASGSTSLAAAILEALEVGTSLLLLDEDTSATNLLVRDARMQSLVERETITPLIDRARELAERGTSIILVTGGGGDWLDVADRTLLMEDYLPRDASERARAVAAEHPTGRAGGTPAEALALPTRLVAPDSLDPTTRRGRRRVKAGGTRTIAFGEETIELGALEQLVEEGQARAIGALLAQLGRQRSPQTVRELAHGAARLARERGLWAIDPLPELALPRPQEIGAALNRFRGLRAAR